VAKGSSTFTLQVVGEGGGGKLPAGKLVLYPKKRHHAKKKRRVSRPATKEKSPIVVQEKKVGTDCHVVERGGGAL